MVKSKFIALFFLLFCSFCILAQEQPFSKNQWEDEAKDLDYTEKVLEKKADYNTPDFDWNFNGKIIKYIFFFLVFGLLAFFLVRYLLSLQSNAAKNQNEVIEVKNLEEAEQNPMQADLHKLIDKLITEQNYREATRAYFLLVLQKLYHQKLIDWKKQKTNFDYVNEVSTQTFHTHFIKVTRYFEITWYGHQPVNQPEFTQIQPQFIDLLNAIENEKK